MTHDQFEQEKWNLPSPQRLSVALNLRFGYSREECLSEARKVPIVGWDSRWDVVARENHVKNKN